jgi:class 3 adenylate cyclase
VLFLPRPEAVLPSIHDTQQLTILTPAARPRRRLPWGSAAAALAVGAVSFAWHLGGSAALSRWELALLAIGVVSSCRLAAWAEERFFVASIGLRPWLRLLLGALLPVLGVAFGLAFCRGFAEVITRLADSRWLGTLLLVGGEALAYAAWVCSAAVGSLVVLVLDAIISALVPNFRSRVTLAILGLLTWGIAVALVLFANGESIVRRVLPTAAAASSPLGLQGMSGILFGLIVLLTGIAVISACSKLADAVMERLHPLTRAFELLGRGDMDVRLEEGGSRDFRALSRSFNEMVQSLTMARRVERAFGAYVGAHVLERIRAQHGESTFPPTSRVATVFFADIRGFTSMSERLAPAVVMDVLNRYFQKVVEVIDAHDGYLDKFVGDAVVVVFNAPIDQPDHAERAVRCAIALQQQVSALNQAGFFPEIGSMTVGIGVATGPLVAGNLGGAQRVDYTVVGDTVNLAARLTGVAPPGEVWVNQTNAEALPPTLSREPLTAVRVKGKEAPVVPYRVWPEPIEAAPSKPVRAA